MNYVSSSVGYRRRSRRWRVRKGRALAVLVLFALIAFALFAKLHSVSRSAAAPNLTSPVSERAFASSRSVSWSNDDRNRLNEELRAAFAPVLPGASGWSFAVIGGDGRTIFDDRDERAVAPASVQKLVVAATALDALGPEYRYHTIFAGQQAIANDGGLDGNLWLIGSGDPSLQSADLRNGVAMLARAGLRRINGGIVVDDTTLRGPGINPHWGADDQGQDYAAPTSAISLNGDTIESRQQVDGVEQRVWTPMTDVAKYVADRVGAMLSARKIAAEARPAIGTAPLESVVLWDHRSAPLGLLENHMLVFSDNHYAEQLLRTVGAEALGTPNDTGGLQAERDFLARHGIPAPGLRLFDGSGLSPENRIAAITIARLLADQEPSLYLLLPLGGRQGTLREYDFTTALGRVRAKSGHLSAVCALAGYVNTMHHGRVVFAFLVDGSPVDADAAIVRAVDRLALF